MSAQANALAVLVIWAHALSASSPVSARQTNSTAVVRLDLDRVLEPVRKRATLALHESVSRYAQWLGPVPLDRLRVTVVPPPREEASDAATVHVNLPWSGATSSMEVESAIAFQVARAYWPDRRVAEDARRMRDGLAWYLQSHIVEAAFNLEYGGFAHSTDSMRLFGGYVTWTFPGLRLSRYTGGLARERFLASNTADDWPESGRRLPAVLTLEAVRSAVAFGTLERYLGWPTLQTALRVLASDDGPLDRRRIADLVGAAVGRDLRWFFDAAFDPAVVYDYAIEAVTTGLGAPCPAAPCYRTEATVVRRGNGRFTGSSHEPVGSFQAGEAMRIEIRFEDGQQVRSRWDGRAARQTFVFESSTPAAVVRLDPDGDLLLDLNRLDHMRNLPAATNVPVGKWAARWVVWLQDVMLACTSML